MNSAHRCVLTVHEDKHFCGLTCWLCELTLTAGGSLVCLNHNESPAARNTATLVLMTGSLLKQRGALVLWSRWCGWPCWEMHAAGSHSELRLLGFSFFFQ